MASIDPRGIRRRIESAERDETGAQLVRFECGHVGHWAAHFALPKPGREDFCFQCGEEARVKTTT